MDIITCGHYYLDIITWTLLHGHYIAKLKLSFILVYTILVYTRTNERTDGHHNIVPTPTQLS